jgi:hypothetical protein
MKKILKSRKALMSVGAIVTALVLMIGATYAWYEYTGIGGLATNFGGIWYEAKFIDLKDELGKEYLEPGFDYPAYEALESIEKYLADEGILDDEGLPYDPRAVYFSTLDGVDPNYDEIYGYLDFSNSTVDAVAKIDGIEVTRYLVYDDLATGRVKWADAPYPGAEGAVVGGFSFPTEHLVELADGRFDSETINEKVILTADQLIPYAGLDPADVPPLVYHYVVDPDGSLSLDPVQFPDEVGPSGDEIDLIYFDAGADRVYITPHIDAATNAKLAAKGTPQYLDNTYFGARLEGLSLHVTQGKYDQAIEEILGLPADFWDYTIHAGDVSRDGIRAFGSTPRITPKQWREFLASGRR